MNFPNLIILDEIPNEDKKGDYQTLLLCKLDWTEIDNHKIKRSKDWILRFMLEKRTQDEERALKSILDEYDWHQELYPNQFKHLFSFSDSFKIPKSYYEEIKHFESLAKSEWKRKRPFDTNVREGCLTVSIEAVASYFYLIQDALYIWNSESIESSEIILILESVSLFRFWKDQTGGGLVTNRALKRFKKYQNKTDLLERLQVAFQDCLELSVVPFRDEVKLREMVKTRMRDEKIKDILK